MMNVLNGVGTKMDPTTAYVLSLNNEMSTGEAETWFDGSKIAETIVSKPADECVKSWIEIEGDADKLACQTHDDLDSQKHFADAIRWMRLFGQSGILMLINDGGLLEEEVNESKITEIEGLRVFDRTEIWYNDIDLYSDPRDKRYGTPKMYYIQPSGGTMFYVHESRMLMFNGDNSTNRKKIQRLGAGKSVLQGMTDDIRNYTQAYHNAFLLLETKSRPVYKMPNLAELLSTAEGEDMAVKRLNIIDMCKHILNTTMIDSEEELTNLVSDLTHVVNVLDQFGLKLSEVSQIPFTVLFGRSPAGMNATGKSDLENWYSMNAQIQERHMKKPLDRLTKLIMLAKNGYFKGNPLKDWSVKFKPLWEPSEKEEAETCKLKAEAKKARSEELKNYVDSGLIADVEGRKVLADDDCFKEYINPALDIAPDVNDNG